MRRGLKKTNLKTIFLAILNCKIQASTDYFEINAKFIFKFLLNTKNTNRK